MSEISIREMLPTDLSQVAELGISSKSSWGYSEDMMSVFTSELTLSKDHLEELLVAKVATIDGKMVGYFTIWDHADGVTELEHLFVKPEWFHQGIGKALFRDALESAKEQGKARLTIIADAFAAGFYEKLGAEKVGDHQSSIPGRTIPIYEIEV